LAPPGRNPTGFRIPGAARPRPQEGVSGLSPGQVRGANIMTAAASRPRARVHGLIHSQKRAQEQGPGTGHLSPDRAQPPSQLVCCRLRPATSAWGWARGGAKRRRRLAVCAENSVQLGTGSSETVLRSWVERAHSVFGEAEVFVCLNNDPCGAAVHDARTLQAMGQGRNVSLTAGARRASAGTGQSDLEFAVLDAGFEAGRTCGGQTMHDCPVGQPERAAVPRARDTCRRRSHLRTTAPTGAGNGR
jgi:hypothetical protein